MDVRFKEIEIASWLYNVVLFEKRAGANDFLNCVKGILPSEVDCEYVLDLIKSIEAPKTVDDWILATASRLSNGDDAFKFDVNNYENKLALTNILSTLKLEGKESPQRSYFNFGILDSDIILEHGEKQLSEKSYKDLWAKFIKDLNSLKGLTYKEFIQALNSLLERYLWCIPYSSKADEADISLFQHSRMTVAFATALVRFHSETNSMNEESVKDNKTKKFRLLNGDMSGIQKYIFDLKIPTFNAKLLRARSFQLWALSKVIADYIVEFFELSEGNVITSAGGKFLLLIHNSSEVTKKLESLQLKLEKYFLNEFAGKLFFILSNGVEISQEDLQRGNLISVINKVGYNAEECKQKKMQKALNDDGHIFESLYKKMQDKGECEFCQTFPAESTLDGHKICSHCNELKIIGEKLAKANKVCFNTKNLDKDASFANLVNIKVKDDKDFGFFINSFKSGNPVIDLPYVAPKNSRGDILTFEEIAGKSTGNNKLAMFKADIDNLGLVFTSSLAEKMSLSRYAEVSRLLHYFFSYYYANFVETNPDYNDKIYTVFSGGDDLCVLGAWDTILDFAYEFRKELEKLTNENPSITLSAGIVLASSSLPVRNIADEAEEELEKSKVYIHKDSKKIKDAITVFDTTLSWEEYNEYIGHGKKILDYMKQEQLSSGVVYKMIDFANRARNIRISGNLRDMVWLSNFRYMLARNIKDKEKNKEIKSLFLKIGSIENIEKSRVAVSYALYAQRKAQNKQEE